MILCIDIKLSLVYDNSCMRNFTRFSLDWYWYVVSMCDDELKCFFHDSHTLYFFVRLWLNKSRIGVLNCLF